MAARILMYASGTTRPLSLDGGRNSKPLLNSALTPWAGLPLEVHRLQALECNGVSGPVDGEHGLLVIMEGRADFVVRQGRRDERFSAVPSSMTTLSGEHRRHVVRVTGSAKAAAVKLPQQWFGRLSLDGPPSNFAQTEPLVRDATVFALVRAMLDEVARGAVAGRLYAESLSMALLSYLVERVPACRSRARGRLSDAECRRLQKYIQHHLHRDLSLVELSGVVGLSPRHFSTLFREAFGVTPHRYVVDHRLAEGARLLSSGSGEIVDVALRVGFCSQSHFTAAFRRAFGTTPKRYAVDRRRFSASLST